jgi:hypothetical protein
MRTHKKTACRPSAKEEKKEKIRREEKSSKQTADAVKVGNYAHA